MDLPSVIYPSVILAPRRFLGTADQIGAGHMVMTPDLAPAHPGEEFFRAVRVDAGVRGQFLSGVSGSAGAGRGGLEDL